MRPSGVPLVCLQLMAKKATKGSRRKSFMDELEILGAIS